MANTWWVVIPQGDQHQPANYLVRVDLTYQSGPPGASDYNALSAGRAIDYGGGLQVVKWKGPFATEAQANTARASQSSPNIGQAAARVVRGARGDVTSAATDAIKSVFGAATQPAMWVRVGEVILGLALIVVGLAKLAEGTPVGNAAGKIATAAMLT